MEQHHILRHVADVAAQVGRVDLLHVDAIDPDRTFARLVKTEQQLFDGGLARADAADEADALAGSDAEGDVVQRRHVGAGVGETDAAKFDVAADGRTADEALARRPFDRLLHDVIDTAQGLQRLEIACNQTGNLGEGSEDAAGQQRAGDQAADRKRVVENQIDAADDGQDIGILLDQHRQVGHRRGKQLGAYAQPAGFADDGLPLALHRTFGADGLDRLDAGKCFDQHGLLLAAKAQTLADGVFQRPLQHQAGADDGRNGQQRNQHQPAAQPQDDDEKQRDEGQIDQRGDGGRGDEVAEHVELVQGVGQAADRLRTRSGLHAQHFFEQRGRQHGIHLLAGNVEEIAAQAFHDEVEGRHDQHADGQHPERFIGLVGHHAVIDVHGEQRRDQGEDVDRQRCQEDF